MGDDNRTGGQAMSDIVKRLREMAEADYYGRDQPHFVPPEECADEIERLRKALILAEDVLSRSPFSNHMWPNGMHPQVGMEQIRAALEAKP